jgi:predicted ester cyclase
MSIEVNRRIARRMIEEVVSANDERARLEVVHPEFHDPTNPPGMQHGLDGNRQIVTLFHRSFPDVRWEIADEVAEDDRVAVRLIMTGTHQGEFFGIAPTGRAVQVEGIHILRIQDGKVIEHLGVNDDLGLMQQLGVIPAAEAVPT